MCDSEDAADDWDQKIFFFYSSFSSPIYVTGEKEKIIKT
jgi:hypothetical protein